jgi:hypothetical protein
MRFIFIPSIRPNLHYISIPSYTYCISLILRYYQMCNVFITASAMTRSDGGHGLVLKIRSCYRIFRINLSPISINSLCRGMGKSNNYN